MKLVLNLLGPPRLMGARHRFEILSGSLAVGRSPEVDWVIPDVSRLISRRHLRIDASHGNFVLTDTSANGVYVNGSDEPVGFGACINLHDGDKLRVGEAEIAVSIDSDEPHLAPASADAGPLPSPPTGRALDGRLDGPFGAPRPSDAPTAAPDSATGAANGFRYQAIDANWMHEQEPTPREPFSGRDPGPGPRPIKALLPVAPGPSASDTLSMLELADRFPDLTLRRLAAAVDEAGQELEPAAWTVFRKKINRIMLRNGM